MMAGIYYRLAKPGIVYGNSFAAAAGFMLAAHGAPNPMLLLLTLVGLGFVIGGACVFNNVIDRDIDVRMERTKGRALVTGQISPLNALVFGAVLSLIGFTFLAVFANVLAFAAAAFGFFAYVVLYSLFAKRGTMYGTEIGSLSGAMPPVVGYAAASGTVDLGAVLLFLILVFWQMPHFFAIALYRKNEYAAAGIPTVPNRKGVLFTKRVMLAYTALFLAALIALYHFGYVGKIFLALMSALGVAWVVMGIRGFRTPDDSRWARRMFRFSLILLVALSMLIAFDAR
ncbi:MAG TPA: heme o synthase [Candidatus Paceibacterota bacterium]|nr:heme o synthase [Candidatus Paceibacterota bacterium]